MKIHQLSLFLENQPGKAVEPCRLLARAGVNISDWEKGRELLQQAGYVVNVTEVVAVEVDDRPGGLAGLLETLEPSGVNIEYMYAFTFGREERAVMVFRFNRPDVAIEHLRAAGVNVLPDVGL